jgi:hypothetical protein
MDKLSGIGSNVSGDKLMCHLIKPAWSPDNLRMELDRFKL